MDGLCFFHHHHQDFTNILVLSFITNQILTQTSDIKQISRVELFLIF